MNTFRRTVLTLAALFAGFAAGIFADNFFLSKTPLTEWAKALNADYANLLTFGATVLLVLVTVIYAGYTYRQVTYSRKQFLLDKQPYVIPSLLSRNFSDYEESASEYTRTLRLEYKIVNVGTETAFSVQPFVSISYPDEQGGMHLLHTGNAAPPAFAYLVPGEEKTGTVAIYETGVESDGLSLIYPSFGYRLLANGNIVPETERSRQKHFPVLTIKVYCRNLVGQWFSSVIYEDITAVIKTSAGENGDYPRAVTRYRLETSQTIYHLPLEIREVSAAEVQKAFALHGMDADFLRTEDV